MSNHRELDYLNGSPAAELCAPVSAAAGGARFRRAARHQPVPVAVYVDKRLLGDGLKDCC
jgi:hypothetical protein